MGLPMMRGGLSVPPETRGTGLEWKRSDGGNRLIIVKSNLRKVVLINQSDSDFWFS